MNALNTLPLRNGTSFLARSAAPAELGSVANDLSEMAATLRRRLLWVAGWTALALALGCLAVLAMAPRYVTTMEFVIDPRGLDVLDKELTPRPQTTDINTAIVETQAKVLVSDSVLRRVVEQKGLQQDPEFNGVPTSEFGRVLASVKRALTTPGRDDDPALVALATLRRAAVVNRLPGSFVVTLAVSTLDPKRSAEIATAIGEAFVEAQSEARRAAARRASEALSARLQELRERVNAAENEIERFRVQSQIVGANGRLVNEQQLSELSTQLVTAQLRTSELRARYEQIEQILRSGSLPDATMEAIQSPLIAQLRGRYAEVKGIEDDLATKLGTRHPELGAVRAQSANLRQRIGDELRRVAASARSDYERSAANRDALSARLTELAGRSNTVNGLLVRLRELEREAQASRGIYESFLNRVRETREQQEVDTGNTRIISPAVPPQRPAGLPAIVLLGVAGVVGLGFGAVSAVARDHLDGRAHTARQVTNLTGLPVLAVLPRLGSVSDRVGKGRILAPGSVAQGMARVYHLLKEGAPKGLRVVLVTSPDDRDGKSAVALDLARVASQEGDRVLLVDADPAGGLSRALGPAARPDLSGVLAGRVPLGEVAHPLENTTIELLAATEEAGFPAGLPQGAATRALAEAAAGFDLVVIDAGLVETDPGARAFLEASRQILLVIRADGTKLRQIENVRTGLGVLASHVAGAVLVTHKSGRGGA